MSVADIRWYSVSQLKSYTRCPEEYYWNRISGVEIPESPAAWTILGTATHSVLDLWEKSGRAEAVEDLLELYRVAFREEVANQLLKQLDLTLWTKTPRVGSVEKDIELRLAAGERMLIDYYQWALSQPWVCEVSELGFELELGRVHVRGFVDLVKRWPDGRLSVTDLKSGNKNEDNRQLGLYAYAARKAGYDVQWGDYHYLKTNSSGGWVDLSRYTEEKLIKDYEALARGIENEIFLPNPGKNCAFCSVKSLCSEWK